MPCSRWSFWKSSCNSPSFFPTKSRWLPLETVHTPHSLILTDIFHRRRVGSTLFPGLTIIFALLQGQQDTQTASLRRGRRYWRQWYATLSLMCFPSRGNDFHLRSFIIIFSLVAVIPSWRVIIEIILGLSDHTSLSGIERDFPCITYSMGSGYAMHEDVAHSASPELVAEGSDSVGKKRRACRWT